MNIFNVLLWPLVIIAWTYYEYRRREILHKERMTFLKHGQEPKFPQKRVNEGNPLINGVVAGLLTIFSFAGIIFIMKMNNNLNYLFLLLIPVLIIAITLWIMVIKELRETSIQRKEK